MDKKTFNYYFDKIISKLNLKYTLIQSVQDEIIKKIKEKLVEITNKKRHYILTESFIDYLTVNYSTALMVLDEIGDTDELFYKAIYSYLFHPYTSYLQNNGVFNPYNERYIHLMDDELKKQIINACESYKLIMKRYKYHYDNSVLIENIIIGLLTECIIQNDLESYSDIVGNFTLQPSFFLQEIKKYGLVRDGILLQEHKVSEWIKSYIESKNKKEIL